MNAIVTAIALYLNNHNLGMAPDRQRHATRLDGLITALPATRTNVDEESMIENFLEHEVGLSPVDSHAHAPALHQAIITARRSNNPIPPNNQGNGQGGNTTTQTPSAPASSNTGLIVGTLIAALVAALLAAVAAFRDNGKGDLAEVKAAVVDSASGTTVLEALTNHHSMAAKTTDLAGLAKESTLQEVRTSVLHTERVVVGSLTWTPKSGKDKGVEKPISLGGLARKSDLKGMARKDDLLGLARKDDLAGLANRGELEKAFAKAGTVAIVTEGEATLLTGDDALRTADPPPAAH